MRTLVLSDSHGYPELIENALEHAEFDAGRDRFVFAGDLIDRGSRGPECLELVESLGAEVLWGNHEHGVLLDYLITGWRWESLGLRDLFLERFRSAAWKLAQCVDGVLVTHAGVCSSYRWDWQGGCREDPERLAELLNREFREATERQLEAGVFDGQSLVDSDSGPLWFRPTFEGVERVLRGVTQVCGHTPYDGEISLELEAAGFYQIDPDTYRGLGDPRRYRYAVIEAGVVRVESGTLG